MIALLPSRSVALDVFGFQIHWYGIMYLLAFILAAILLPNLQRHRRLALTRDEWLNLITWGVIGVVVGGRLGYVLFYEPYYFALHPAEIIAVWKGGMASHGGFLGVAGLLAWTCLRKKISMLRVADTIVVPVAIGLALGRLGNFINQELYGSVTSLPWGISIPDVEGLRHPTQLYAMGKDLLIAGLCYLHLRSTKDSRPGRTVALFLVLYGIGRFLIEYLRVQDYPPAHIGMLEVTRGQLLTLPVFLFGVLLWIWFRPRRFDDDSPAEGENRTIEHVPQK
jgi:phosphatidylglycerol---prolipoprotein diacylglyceryl transferase